MASPSAIAHKESILTGLVVVGAVFAWAISPIQRYADPGLLFFGGFFVAIGLLLNAVLPWGKGKVALTLFAMPFASIAIGALVLYGMGMDAARKSRWGDKRCMIVQRAMLHPTSKTRSDIADVFTALGCRPQGGEPEGPNGLYVKGTPTLTKEEAEKRRVVMDSALANEVSVNRSDEEPAPVSNNTN